MIPLRDITVTDMSLIYAAYERFFCSRAVDHGSVAQTHYFLQGVDTETIETRMPPTEFGFHVKLLLHRSAGQLVDVMINPNLDSGSIMEAPKIEEAQRRAKLFRVAVREYFEKTNRPLGEYFHSE